MDDLDTFSFQTRQPTAARPLLGLTVLVVEDSRFASEALRLLCLRSGARIRRADSLRSAARHLQVYRPSVAIIDLGLRDGNGAELIAELAQAQPKSSVVLGMSGEPDAEAAAKAAGADAFIAKPVSSLAEFQALILSHLPEDRRPAGPRALRDEEIIPDPIAYQDDLAHIADVMGTADDGATMDYVAQFLRGIARSAQDQEMLASANAFADLRRNGAPTSSASAELAALVQSRLEQKIAM